MRFDGMSSNAVVGLLAAAGVAVAALHLLRPRPPRRIVPTLLFWRDVETAPRAARLLGNPRNWLTYALLLSIAGAIVLALGKPRSDVGGDRPVVVVVDAGWTMAATDGTRSRWDEAQSAAICEIHQAGGMRDLALIIADENPRLVAGFTDSPAVALRRLRESAPADRPSASAAGLQLAATILAGRTQGEIAWITDRPALPVPSAVYPVRRIGVGVPVHNAGIIQAAFVAGADESAAGELHVRVGNWGTRQSLCLHVESAGLQAVDTPARWIEDGAIADFVLAGQKPDGHVARLDLRGDAGPTGDNTLEFVCPRRPSIEFAVSAEIPAPLKAALLSVGRISSGNSDASIAVGTAESAPGFRGRAIVIHEALQATAHDGDSVMIAPSELTQDVRLGEAVCGGGAAIDLPGAQPLLYAGDAVVAAIEPATTNGPRLHLSDALFKNSSSVWKRAGFPVLMARASHQLAGWTPGTQAISGERVVTDATRFPTAGAVGSRTLSDLTTTAPRQLHQDARSKWSAEPFELLLGAALLLLLIESTLYLRGRIA